MSDAERDARRDQLRRNLQGIAESTLDERVERYLAVAHNGIVPGHHFAAASTECVDLYRDGHFLSTVMVTQSVAEGIRRFVVERNEPRVRGECPEQTAALVERGVLSQECADAFVRIWRSFRNDVHHMHPKVVTVPFEELALSNVKDLAAIEHEVFAWETHQGKLIPKHPKYWDVRSDGSVGVFLRLL